MARLHLIIGFILLSSAQAQSGTKRSEVPTHLNPYRLPMVEEEMATWKPEALEGTLADVPGLEASDMETSWLNYVGARLGYAYGHHRIRHQMDVDIEFGLRKSEAVPVFGFGPRLGIQTLGGSTSVFGSIFGHALTRFGLGGLYLGGGRRDSEWRPELGILLSLWRPFSGPQSQWTVSLASRVDFGSGGAGWLLAFALGHDWQW